MRVGYAAAPTAKQKKKMQKKCKWDATIWAMARGADAGQYYPHWF